SRSACRVPVPRLGDWALASQLLYMYASASPATAPITIQCQRLRFCRSILFPSQKHPFRGACASAAKMTCPFDYQRAMHLLRASTRLVMPARAEKPPRYSTTRAAWQSFTIISEKSPRKLLVQLG